MSTEEQKANLFYLTIGNDDDNESIEGRSDAVARAKSLSQETSQRVNLERADGMVSMQFSDGILETYVCETREKKPARRKPEAENTDESTDESGEEQVIEKENATDEETSDSAEEPQTEEPSASEE